MKWKGIVVIAIAFILIPVAIGNYGGKAVNVTERSDALPVIASKSNPFNSIMATPVAIYYDGSTIHAKPLLVKNMENASSSIIRFEEMYDMSNAIIVDGKNVTDESIKLALNVWDKSSRAMVVENSYHGYRIAVSLAPLASYMDMPIFIANSTNEIKNALQSLGVKEIYSAGDVAVTGYKNTNFEDEKDAMNYVMSYLKSNYGKINYIVMTNPKDIKRAKVLDSISYDYSGYVNSGSTLHGLHILLSGMNYSVSHTFTIPPEFKNARVKIDLINDDSEDVEKWGDRLFMHVTTPDNITFVYTSTMAGIPKTENGKIIKDRLHFETAVFNKPGKYRVDVMGVWIKKAKGRYHLHITVEKIDDTCYPLMHNLSSMAPYLAAYHHGIVFAHDFSFAGNESVGIPGVAYPVKNEYLVEPCNEHVLKIHSMLNNLLSNISGIDSERALWQHYSEEPIYIAIMGDATMIPMFYYHNPDSDYLSGQGVASDFIYGDIDPDKDDMENDSYSYYPTMENAVGRVTGYDAEDCSAFIARTSFYNEIISRLGSWKNNATVQTGTGIEFQKIPVITPLVNRLKSVIGFGPVRDEPTKFFTGESKFINMHISHDFEEHGMNVKSAYRLDAQREGVILNRPGGKYQIESNYIFAFDHGTYYLFEAGDMLDFDQFGLGLKTGLSGKGSYDVRHIVNTPYNPSVAFIESCIVGKIEGLVPQNCLTQAFIHAGIGAIVASTRYTADPGYLEPGLIFKGFGFYGYFNATKNLILYNKYPSLHFGGLLADNFVLDLLNNNSSVGMALRNAKNKYLPMDANSTFMWTPPLSNAKPYTLEETRVLDKKYVCLHEFTLYGDPAFNPYP